MKKNFLILFLLIILATVYIYRTRITDERETITFSTWGSQSEIKMINSLLADFEKKYNVKVEVIHIPQNYFQKLHLLFASKQAPDVIFINNFYVQLYAKANLLERLDAYFEKDIENSTYFKNSLTALSYKNHLYAMPRDVSNLVVYYNKSLFDKYKIEYPKETWTFADFLTLSKEIKKHQGVFAVGFEENPLFWLPFLWSNKGGLIDENGNYILNSPNSLSALAFYLDLRTKYKYAPSRIDSANQTMAQMFLNEKIAMQISGRWLVPKYRNEAEFDWDIINLPNGSAGSIVGSDSSGWAMSASSKHKLLAFELIKYLSSKESISRIAEEGLIVPARKDVAYSKIFLNKNKKPLHAEIFLTINNTAKITPLCENYNKLIAETIKKLEPYFIDKSIDTASSKLFSD